MADTIVACSTPWGRSAVAVVRLSGPDALSVGKRMCPDGSTWKPRRLSLRRVSDGARHIDEFVHRPLGSAVQDKAVVVLFIFAGSLMGMTFTVVDVVPHLAQGLVVTKNILEVYVVACHGVDFCSGHAVGRTQSCAHGGRLRVGSLA